MLHNAFNRIHYIITHKVWLTWLDNFSYINMFVNFISVPVIDMHFDNLALAILLPMRILSMLI